MAEHSDKMSAHMEMMMKNPDHHRAMVKMMRRNPTMRDQMRAIINEAEKPGSAQTSK